MTRDATGPAVRRHDCGLRDATSSMVLLDGIRPERSCKVARAAGAPRAVVTYVFHPGGVDPSTGARRPAVGRGVGSGDPRPTAPNSTGLSQVDGSPGFLCDSSRDAIL